MFRKCAAALLPLIVTGLTANPLTAARPANDPGRAAFQRFNGGPPLSPLPAAEPEKPKPKDEEPKRPSETDAAMRAQEQSNLFRRMAVCDRVKQIALESSDAKLEAYAIRLEERATEVYKQRTANLTGGKRTEGGAK